MINDILLEQQIILLNNIGINVSGEVDHSMKKIGGYTMRVNNVPNTEVIILIDI